MRLHTYAWRGGLVTLAGLTLYGCGGSASSVPAAKRRATPTVARAAVAHPLRVDIVSPKPGAHTGATVTVRVRLTGTPPGGTPLFRYVLDGRLIRHGPARITFRELVPGRHRLEVMLSDDIGRRARTAFTVRAPVPVGPAAPETSMTVPAQAPSQTQANPAPAPKSESTAPAPSATQPSSPGGGIPQGNGGDSDSDNNGGRSDGDGNV